MVGNVGVATGPLLAAVLLGFLDWRLVALVLVVPVLVALVAGYRLEFDERAGMRERRDAETDGGTEISSVREFVGRTKLLFAGGFVLVFAVGICYGLYYRGATTFLPDILADLPLFEPVVVSGRTLEPSRYVYAGLLLLGGAGQYAGGRLVEAVRTEVALVASYLTLAAIAVVFIPLTAAGILPLLVGAGVVGFVVFGVAPINQEAISAYSAADLRGLSFGYTYMAIFGVGALGATMAGAILTRWDAGVLFVVLAGIALVGTGLAAILIGPWGRFERA
jgi:MFS family permease